MPDVRSETSVSRDVTDVETPIDRHFPTTRVCLVTRSLGTVGVFVDVFAGVGARRTELDSIESKKLTLI